MCSVRGAASTPTLHRPISLGQAAFAISATRSQVVACRLGRASIRASHAGEMLRRAERAWHGQKPIGRGLLLQRGQDRATKGTAGRLAGRLVERDLASAAPAASALGQWPTWQTKPEENRSFTID